MSLLESGDSSGEISLKYLFDNPGATIFSEPQKTLDDIAFLICRGGWPIATTLDKDYALETAYDYYKAVTDIDMSRVDGIKRSPTRTKRLMRSLARHQGTQVTIAGIKSNMAPRKSI